MREDWLDQRVLIVSLTSVRDREEFDDAMTH